MAMAAAIAGSAGGRAVVHLLKRFGTRREQKRIALRGEGCAREIAIRQKSPASIQP
ncbi:MAG: hypothetical protein ACXWLB_11455 [Reyranella sp.]